MDRTIDFTNCQEKAILSIDNFLRNDNENIFLLSGAAGTGKTTVVTQYERKRKDYKIIYLAPTHKAKNVLKEMGKKLKLPNSYGKYSTIHSFFCISISYDKKGKARFETNAESFARKYQDKFFNTNLLIVIDEISMIGNDLYEIIIEYSKHYPQIKIILLGDICQLPPICKIKTQEDEEKEETEEYGEESVEEISKFFKNPPKHSACLFEVKRTADKDIVELNKICRQYTLDENTENFKSRINTFRKTSINPRIKIVTSKNHFTRLINENIEKKSSYVIASRNSTVTDYIKNIRERIYPDCNFPYGVGEKIYFTSYFSFDNNDQCNCIWENRKSMFCNRSNFYTSTEQKIISCREGIETSEYFNVSYKFFEFEIDYKLHTEEFLKVRKIHPDSLKIFNKAVFKKKNEIKNSEKNNTLYWKEFHKNKKLLHSPFTSSIAITAYKAQGSSYQNVFVDADDIENCRRTTFLKSKEIYTAVTRAKNFIYIFIDLEKKLRERPRGITKCCRCRCWRKYSEFKINKKGILIKTCNYCCEKAKIKRDASKSI